MGEGQERAFECGGGEPRASGACVQPSGRGGGERGADEEHPARRTRAQLLRIPGVKAVLVSFFCYSAFEATCGN